MPSFLEVQETETDSLVKYLVKTFFEARFDEILDDGSMYCSDSNACLDPHEIAKYLRENFGAK